MKYKLQRVIVILTAAVFISFSVVAQERKEVWAPTTLIEISPEVAAEWHRLNGKIEDGVGDKGVMEAVKNRLLDWLEKSGNSSEVTFEEAQTALLTELKLVDQKFDIAKKANNLSSWPASTAVEEVLLVKDFPVNSPETMVAIAPDRPATVEVALTTNAAVEPNSPTLPLTEKTQIPSWMLAIIMFSTLTFGMAGWRLYPKFFQARVDGYVLSSWERLKKRSVFSFVWMIAAFFIAGFLVPGIAGYFTAK